MELIHDSGKNEHIKAKFQMNECLSHIPTILKDLSNDTSLHGVDEKKKQ